MNPANNLQTVVNKLKISIRNIKSEFFEKYEKTVIVNGTMAIVKQKKRLNDCKERYC